MSSRREFLTGVIAAAGTAIVPGAPEAAEERSRSRPLQLLILGGTGNIGPYHVQAAVARGHHVAVFSRGHTRSDLPPGVEQLIGDRNSDLSSLKGRDWDGVLDIATFGPGWVRSLGEALKGHVRHYTFISTVSVYDRPEANRITDETSPVLTYHGSADPYSVTSEGRDYGALKRLCELEAEKQFPGRTLIARPSSIAGPSDTHPYIYYWPLRAQRGGELLAVGDPHTPVEFVDVRDMASWIVRMIEKQTTGIYNVTGPIPPADLAGLINASRATAAAPGKVTWVTSSWLSMRADKDTFDGLNFWAFNKGHLTGFSNARAIAQGLTTRPMDASLADEVRWLQQQSPQPNVFIGFRPKADASGFQRVDMPWPEYLAREKALLSAWHTQERKRS